MDKVDDSFTKYLPKIELHAHLTGSITRFTLHQIWLSRKFQDPKLSLEDPLTAIPHGEGTINIATFFPIFDKYIYGLVNSLEAVRFATEEVLRHFLNDGVVYVELRTTPRAIPSKGVTKGDYVKVVLETMSTFMEATGREMVALLILSVDRRNSIEEAMEVVDLALKYQKAQKTSASRVVGLDLCGNPLRTPITHLAPAFALAHSSSLPITLHFAETPTSATPAELSTLLSWHPSRLGHVIHVPHSFQQEIAKRKLGLELCLSCNVQAGLSQGGFKAHHFGYWRDKGCPIALGTDDVGIFGSRLSEEYLLAAEHFGLSRAKLIDLSRGAVDAVFGGEDEKVRLRALLGEFERDI